MQVAKLTDIIIKPNRQRQEFDPGYIGELAESIEKGQLQHAPVLRTEDGKLVLVSGENRIKAMQMIWDLAGSFKYNGQDIPPGYVPYTNIGELNELAAEEAELDENLRRRDLTWQELAAAHARLHNLRNRQKVQKQLEDLEAAGVTDPNPTINLNPQTVADTARELFPERTAGKADGELGSAQDQVRKELIVSRYLDNPDVAKAKSVDEAFKILKRQEQSKQNAELARTVGATFDAQLHKLYNQNCIEWMSTQPAEQFDVILTDPPYGMDAQNFGDGGGKFTGIEHHYDDSHESWQQLMAIWAKWAFHTAKPEAHAYVFCDFDRFHELKDFMQKAGWYVFRTPFVVHKQNSGRVPLPDRGPRRQYELVLYAIKGNKPVTHIYPDVIPVTGDDNLGHGAQKPVALYVNLLQRSVKPGDKVLDSFAGSGTIFEACHTMKCYATGIEMSKEYYGMCLRRLQTLKALETPAVF